MYPAVWWLTMNYLTLCPEESDLGYDLGAWRHSGSLPAGSGLMLEWLKHGANKEY